MFRNWNKKKGAALIVCLGILSVLTILGISFSQLMIVERAASSNYSDGMRAKFAAQSGIEYSTNYLRKLARVKQHSDPRGDLWWYDPFYTDEQGRPIFDINPDLTQGVLGHPPAFRLGAILDNDPGDTYSEEYTGYVHATYYEEALDTGTPGNYFQVKIQSCASQFYLNPHPAHLQGLENMLTTFIRATVDNGRTHQIPQPDGTVLAGRAFFEGFPTTPGDYESNTGGVRTFVRAILQAREDPALLPLGIYSSKQQLLQVLQTLSGSIPGGVATPEEVYADLKNFVTCHAWVDNSVLYLNPESSPNPYALSVATNLLSFPGSTGSGAPTDRNPVATSTTISGTGPYYNFTPSAVQTYYSCRELMIGGGPGTGDPITGRAPIDINAASEEVLTAVFTGLTGKRPDLGSGSSYFAAANRSVIDFALAKTIAGLIVDARDPSTSPAPSYNTYFSNFYTWDQFYGFLNTFASGVLSHEQSDIIKAMANPNTDVNKFNPDTTLRKRIDKGDLTFNDSTGKASFTTELCFGSMGYYDVTSVGKVLGTAGVTPTGGPSRIALAAKSEFSSIVRVYEVFRDTTQRDFETDRDAFAGRNQDTPTGIPTPGPPSNERPVEVVEYAVISYPEPRPNTQVGDPGTDPSQEPMRPRSTDDTGNDAHDPSTYTGNIVHAAEYDGQIALNGMIATQYYQSANGDAPPGGNGTGYSNAQWAPYVVTDTTPPPSGAAMPFPIPSVELVSTPAPGSYVYTPPEFGFVPVPYDSLGKGVYTKAGFDGFAEEGYRSLLVGFNLNNWEPNAPVEVCSGGFSSDPGRIMRADYDLSDLVSPSGSRTMREGRNLYPLGFNPRAHYASSLPHPLSLTTADRKQTYLRYHNANVHRFEGGVQVWVKPDHDFTLSSTHDLHRGTVLAFRNSDPNSGSTGSPTISHFRPGGGGALNNRSGTTFPAGEVVLNTQSIPFYDSDDYISNAFIIRFDSAFSMRAAIWGNNHFQGNGFSFVPGAPGSSGTSTPPIAEYGSKRVRSTPQVWATNSVSSLSSASGTGMQDGIRCVPGKWQTVQIWYRRNPAYGVSPFVPLSVQFPGATPTPKFGHGNGYRFLWSLPVQGETSNIALPGTSPIQPGVSSWPSGNHPVWHASWSPLVSGGTHPLSAPNPNYRYCSTVWEDNFRDISISYIGTSAPPGGSALFTPEDRLIASGLFGAFMSSAASISADTSVAGMLNPLTAGSPGPAPDPLGDSPIAPVAAITATYDGAWFGSAHPDWFDGRFKRTGYTDPVPASSGSTDVLLDFALGGGVGTASLGSTNVGSDWDDPGTFSTDVGNLAFATIDNLQVHPFDFSFSRTVRDSSVGSTAEPHLGEDIEDPSPDFFQFNDMQKRYWDAGHRFGEHSQAGHFFSGASYPGTGEAIIHGIYKKYCRQIAQDALLYGVVTIGTAAFTTYSGNISEPSGWSDSRTPHPFDNFFARQNMGPVEATSDPDTIQRLEYVSYIGNSGLVAGVAGGTSLIPIPYHVSVRVWKDAQLPSGSVAKCCDAEFSAPTASNDSKKAEDGGSGGATTSLNTLLTSPDDDRIRFMILDRSEAVNTFISYSAGLSSDTLHAVANESPFLDDVTITYLRPASVVMTYEQIVD